MYYTGKWSLLWLIKKGEKGDEGNYHKYEKLVSGEVVFSDS